MRSDTQSLDSGLHTGTHTHVRVPTCTFTHMYTHVCTHTTHTQTVWRMLGGTVKMRRNVNLVTVPGVDSGREHAASAEKMDRTLFTGK